jgi:hypothetical protein
MRVFLEKTGQMLQGQETVRLSSVLINTTKMDIDGSRNRDGNGVYRVCSTEP